MEPATPNQRAPVESPHAFADRVVVTIRFVGDIILVRRTVLLPVGMLRIGGVFGIAMGVCRIVRRMMIDCVMVRGIVVRDTVARGLIVRGVVVRNVIVRRVVVCGAIFGWIMRKRRRLVGQGLGD